MAHNRQLIQEILGVGPLIEARQVHGVEIAEIEKYPHEPPEADVLITRQPLLPLLVQTADCQGALIVDPVRHVLAAIHTGWRGQVSNIYVQTIRFMQQKYGCSPQDLHMVISPSLGWEHAEFKNYALEFPSFFTSFQKKECHFDLVALSH